MFLLPWLLLILKSSSEGHNVNAFLTLHEYDRRSMTKIQYLNKVKAFTTTGSDDENDHIVYRSNSLGEQGLETHAIINPATSTSTSTSTSTLSSPNNLNHEASTATKSSQEKIDNVNETYSQVIGTGSTLSLEGEGTLTFEESLLIQGTFIGKLNCTGICNDDCDEDECLTTTVKVGLGGVLLSDVNCVMNVDIDGKLIGDAICDRIRIGPTAELYGDITARIICVEEGATIVGSITSGTGVIPNRAKEMIKQPLQSLAYTSPNDTVEKKNYNDDNADVISINGVNDFKVKVKNNDINGSSNQIHHDQVNGSNNGSRKQFNGFKVNGVHKVNGQQRQIDEKEEEKEKPQWASRHIGKFLDESNNVVTPIHDTLSNSLKNVQMSTQKNVIMNDSTRERINSQDKSTKNDQKTNISEMVDDFGNPLLPKRHFPSNNGFNLDSNTKHSNDKYVDNFGNPLYRGADDNEIAGYRQIRELSAVTREILDAHIAEKKKDTIRKKRASPEGRIAGRVARRLEKKVADGNSQQDQKSRRKEKRGEIDNDEIPPFLR